MSEPKTVIIGAATMTAADVCYHTVTCERIPGTIPGLTIEGLYDSDVLEIRSRVRNALRLARVDVYGAHLKVTVTPHVSRLERVELLGLAIAVACAGAVSGDNLPDWIASTHLVGAIDDADKLARMSATDTWALALTKDGSFATCAPAIIDHEHARAHIHFVKSLSDVIRADQSLPQAMQTAWDDPNCALLTVLFEDAVERLEGTVNLISVYASRIMGAVDPEHRADYARELALAGADKQTVTEMLYEGRPPIIVADCTTRANIFGGGAHARAGALSHAAHGTLILTGSEVLGSTIAENFTHVIEEGSLGIVRVDGMLTLPVPRLIIRLLDVRALDEQTTSDLRDSIGTKNGPYGTVIDLRNSLV